MATAMKCDFCAQPGVSLTGETNGVIVCIDHARTQDPLGIVTPNPRPLPLHRTEAGYPNCSTCDGGGCYDCTDPA